jgi:hypothetical protein
MPALPNFSFKSPNEIFVLYVGTDGTTALVLHRRYPLYRNFCALLSHQNSIATADFIPLFTEKTDSNIWLSFPFHSKMCLFQALLPSNLLKAFFNLNYISIILLLLVSVLQRPRLFLTFIKGNTYTMHPT